MAEINKQSYNMNKTIYQSPDAMILAFWQSQAILTVSNEFDVPDFEDEGELF